MVKPFIKQKSKASAQFGKSRLPDAHVMSPSPLPEKPAGTLALNAVLYAAAREAFIAASQYAETPSSFEQASAATKAIWCEIALAAIITHGAAPFKPIQTAPDNRDILIFLDGEWRKFATTQGKKREWYSRDGYKISDDEARQLNLVWCEFPGRPQHAENMIIQTRHGPSPLNEDGEEIHPMRAPMPDAGPELKIKAKPTNMSLAESLRKMRLKSKPKNIVVKLRGG